MMCIIYEEMSEQLTVNIKSDSSLPSDMNTCDPVVVVIKTWSFSDWQHAGFYVHAK